MATRIQLERRKLNEGLAKDIQEIKEMLQKAERVEAARVEREAASMEREAVIRADVKSLKHTVDGNEKPGLKTDVQIIKDQLSRVNWAMGLFVAALIADIVTRIYGK